MFSTFINGNAYGEWQASVCGMLEISNTDAVGTELNFVNISSFYCVRGWQLMEQPYNLWHLYFNLFP